MIDTRNFEAFFKHVTDALPRGAFTLHADLDKNLRAALNAALERMNFVTREEFDIQIALLERTRTKLNLLEKLVAEQESAHQADESPESSNLPNPDK
ncbi:MAG: accessory factor UbiK family protein [Gammaproteobacteria bacterium]|nr:accessory factor UbiK family protein [Gammaproteobacteria bacterium]